MSQKFMDKLTAIIMEAAEYGNPEDEEWAKSMAEMVAPSLMEAVNSE